MFSLGAPETSPAAKSEEEQMFSQAKGAANMDLQQDSSADCDEGDYVTLANVRELLKVQESTFKSLFESMIQLDSAVKDVQVMKISSQYTKKDVESYFCILIK